MDKKKIDRLVGYIRSKFPDEGMDISTGIDMLNAALERVYESLTIEAETINGKRDPAALNEIEGYLELISDLMFILEGYSERLDLTGLEYTNAFDD